MPSIISILGQTEGVVAPGAQIEAPTIAVRRQKWLLATALASQRRQVYISPHERKHPVDVARAGIGEVRAR